jgi:hypothetical protein
MGRRPEAHDLGTQTNEPIVAIMGQVIEGNMDRHERLSRRAPKGQPHHNGAHEWTATIRAALGD